ncbi:MAG: glycoside hydrolase family 36 protein [Spirochaetaceae bacterium]
MIKPTHGSFTYLSSGSKKREKIPLASSETGDEGSFSLPRARLVSSEHKGSLRFDVVIETRAALEAVNLSVSFELDTAGIEKVYANGFQSWTESRERTPKERMGGLNPLLLPFARRFRLPNYGDYTFAEYSRARGNFHGYTFLYFVRSKDRAQDSLAASSKDGSETEAPLELWGSMDETRGYTVFRWDQKRGILTVEKECEGLVLQGGELLLSLGRFSGREEDVFNRYFSSWGIHSDPEPMAGWTSWYRHYRDIHEETVRENLEAFASRKVPLDVFQIDDGWQRAVGDWLETDDSFPSGMAAIAAEISRRGFAPGLWIAPFLAEEGSQLFREHPDWCVRDEAGNPLVAGYNPFQWSGRFYALDPLYPQVQEYVRRVFRTVFEEWKFSFVKLDFLYAAALVPRDGKSRGRIMFESLRMLREFAGGNTILGCGVPLGSGFGLLDYCRIGADAAPYWEDRKLALMGYRERVSTVNSLRSTIGRRSLSGRAFGNDPDVFILREGGQKMSRTQRQSLFIVNQIYGRVLFTSDNPAEYDKEMWELYLSQFPLQRTRVLEADEKSVRFMVGERLYRGYHNLSRKKVSLDMPEGLYYGFREGFASGGSLTLQPYESRVYLTVDGKPYAPAGSTGMLFPGSEIENFRFDEGKVWFSVKPGVQTEGTIFLKVPSFLKECEVNGTVYPCEEKVDMSLVVVPRQ